MDTIAAMERAALCFSDGHVRVRLKYIARLRQLHQGAISPAPVTALDSPVAYWPGGTGALPTQWPFQQYAWAVIWGARWLCTVLPRRSRRATPPFFGKHVYRLRNP